MMKKMSVWAVTFLTTINSFIIVLLLLRWKSPGSAVNFPHKATQPCNCSAESMKGHEIEQLLTLSRYHVIKKLINDKLLVEHNSFNDMFHLLSLMDDNCSNLFISEVNNQFLNSKYFKSKSDNMANKLKTAGNVTEGYSGLRPTQVFFYILLARQSWVRQVCEIGFNAGHSALYWLASSNNTRLVSFDLGSHDYAKVMAGYMKTAFPDRFHIVWGDSTKSVPEYVQNLTLLGNPLSCDVIVIDGGHSYKVALADMQNMRAFARSPRHLVVIDDTPCVAEYCENTARALREMRHSIKPVFGCIHYPQLIRGFSVGYYVTEERQS